MKSKSLATRAAAFALLLVSMTSSGCIVTTDGDSDLTVYNDSSYAIYELYLTQSSSTSWGQNQLGFEPLLPGEAITLATDCGIYDVQVWDEDEISCALYDLDLCFESAEWVITDFTLNTCGFAHSDDKK